MLILVSLLFITILLLLIFLFKKVRKLETMLEQQQVEHNEMLVLLKQIKEEK
ncbi:hypothetical protein IMZ08_13375 [Bacillus luteolus]|uniref:ATP synthase F0 subunit 8 n=1 Tax=Litchfieldia luteola TaxID=682179 RepID=A0ABR9QKS9_9BACI|nr:hypothetical protein [Cytobacillus luteolus]MBE4909054.1 hypothetical protein [Cytobacillus luteolus]MBP1941910.1 heme/copper-type cytochrome/quinol oxidase subunit 2 [Cytobacillus luteolus]